MLNRLRLGGCRPLGQRGGSTRSSCPRRRRSGGGPRGSCGAFLRPKITTRAPTTVRGWQNTVGNLIELFWLKNKYYGPQFTGACVQNSGLRFHRIRDFKQYYFNSIPQTSYAEPPVWNISRAPQDRSTRTAPQNMSYRGRDSGGWWGNHGSHFIGISGDPYLGAPSL